MIGKALPQRYNKPELNGKIMFEKPRKPIAPLLWKTMGVTLVGALPIDCVPSSFVQPTAGVGHSGC